MIYGRDGRQVFPSGSYWNTPKKNLFYVLQTRLNQEGSPDVVPWMLKVFHLDAYDFLNTSVTLSFVTPYVALRFDVSSDVFIDLFSLCSSWWILGDIESL